MTRRFRQYDDPAIRTAIDKARESTGWPDDMTLPTKAAHILAGHSADDAAIDDAARHVALMMDRAE